MSIDMTSPEYQAARERLYEHVREQHTDHQSLATRPDDQKQYLKEVREGYEKSITEAQRSGERLYSDPNYAAGAKAGVRDWEREQVKEAERETVKIRVA